MNAPISRILPAGRQRSTAREVAFKVLSVGNSAFQRGKNGRHITPS